MAIPPTRHGLPALVCISAMQKSIRRGLEVEAMQFACELMHTSKNFHTMVLNRLQIISHEDVNTATQPHIVPFVFTACEQSKAWYNPDFLCKARMPMGNAIRMLARAEKSREGDHFHAAVGLPNMLLDETPEIPDWAYDQHTREGKRMGRGLKHFREVGTQLNPPQDPVDPYIDKAYKMWAIARGEKPNPSSAEMELDLSE